MTEVQKKTILVVEDDTALRRILQDKLTTENFSVLTAADGEAALTVFFKNLPDLILLDIYMPKMNGIEMLEKLRSDKRGENVPVLLLTNDDDPQDIKQTLKNNATDFLIKTDWSLEDVVGRIKEVLNIS